MPYIEQLLYGHNHLTESAERQALAHSAGMGAEVATEVGAVCDAWGQMPDLGLTRRVLLAQPLQATMPSMRGRLHTVIAIAPGTVPLFHAVVLSDAVYSSFGRNPYALAQVIEFVESWQGRQGMDRLEVEADGLGPLVVPSANPADAGLIAEAVLQFILKGRLSLPLEQTVSDSDRAMALTIACLPDKDRKVLKFASFTTNKVNAYDICCLATQGATFAGWQRLLMAQIDPGVTEQQAAYKEHLAKFLARGDLAGIARVSSRHDFTPPLVARPLVASLQADAPQVKPRPSVPAPTPRPTSFGMAATIGTARPGPQTPGQKRRGLGAGASVPLPDHGLDPAAGSRRSKSALRKRVRRNMPLAGSSRGAGGRLIRTVSLLLLLFCMGWVGTMWLEGRTLSESLEWAGLPGMDGHTEELDPAGTLLEVVDVGQVYDRARRQVGNKGLGLNAAGDKGREKALGHLQSDATDPLLAQVALFVRLTEEGIQQSGRPDREVERLKSLAGQGTVLANEMSRLELAWYSLTTGVNWVDLGTLSDHAVEARRDSLAKAEKGALADVRSGMKMTSICQDLVQSRRRMEGMAGVVGLFQESHWSASWEKRLAAAAEKVSPTAGQTTRAYRNCAFAFLRLKRAERAAANQDLPFAGQFDSAQWPSPQVKAVLPVLRKEAGRFSDQQAPALLGATLALYTSLEAPDQTVESLARGETAWAKLQRNRAVGFDPELYQDFLSRLRYEAASRYFARSPDSEQRPQQHLLSEDALAAAAAFGDSLSTLTRSSQWQAMARAATDPFLRRWAEHLGSNMQARLARREEDFATVWNECRTKVAVLQSQVSSGFDWSEAWRDVYQAATEAHQEYASILSEDAALAPKFAYLDSLEVALVKPLPLAVNRATVRLEQGQLREPAEVQLELRLSERGSIWTSDPFVVGPAAPAGSGWVGTVSLDWVLAMSPRHRMSVRVVSAGEQSELLLVDYPSLDAGGGPGGMLRPKATAAGSVAFRTDLAAYWQALNVPDLGPVF